jgi:hypothetical protein
MKNLTHIDENFKKLLNKVLFLKIAEFSNINFLNVEAYFSFIFIYLA